MQPVKFGGAVCDQGARRCEGIFCGRRRLKIPAKDHARREARASPFGAIGSALRPIATPPAVER